MLYRQVRRQIRVGRAVLVTPLGLLSMALPIHVLVHTLHQSMVKQYCHALIDIF